MRLAIPFAALVVGFLLAYQSQVSLPVAWAPYLSLATIAGLDTVFGGVRSGMEGKFNQAVFVSGFVVNSLLAAFLAWLGDTIGVDLYLAAVVTLGGRIFLNLSMIRRFYITAGRQSGA